jgi:hypothetical protein
MKTTTLEIVCPKWNCNIVVQNFPADLPPKVVKFASRYLMYYEYGDAIRNGLRVIDWAAEKPRKPRGPVVMKDETLEKKTEERLEGNKAMELRMMATSVARRKGITYAAAKASLMLDWNCDANGIGYTVENPRPDPDPELEELYRLDDEQDEE